MQPDSSRPRKPSKSARGQQDYTLVWLFILFACSILAVFGPWIVVRQFRIAAESKGNAKWPSVTGMMVDSKLVPTNSGRDKPGLRKFRTILTYRYVVDGSEYFGHRFSYDVTSYRNDESLARSYPVGRKVTVYYDPLNPRNCILKRGDVRIESFWLGLGFSILVTIGSWGFIAFTVHRNWLSISPWLAPLGRLFPPAVSKAAIDVYHRGQRSLTPSRVRYGLAAIFVLACLSLYSRIHSDPPVVRALRSRGNVVDYAGEKGRIGAPEHPGRDRPWSNAQIYKLKLFVVKDLQPLSAQGLQLANLDSLDLEQTELDSLSFIRDLTSLGSLDLEATRVCDLAPLARLTNLRWLGLAGTPVNDLTPLAGLESLEFVDLTDTLVSDLSPVTSCPGLRAIRVGGSRVHDLTPLVEVPDLHSISLDATQVRENLSVLTKMKELSTLDLRDTKLPAAEVINIQSMLPDCLVLPPMDRPGAHKRPA